MFRIKFPEESEIVELIYFEREPCLLITRAGWFYFDPKNGSVIHSNDSENE